MSKPKQEPVSVIGRGNSPSAPSYLVVSNVNVAKLTESVTALLAEGWAPTGGICIAEFHEPVSARRMPGYHQAMVRR